MAKKNEAMPMMGSMKPMIHFPVEPSWFEQVKMGEEIYIAVKGKVTQMESEDHMGRDEMAMEISDVYLIEGVDIPKDSPMTKALSEMEDVDNESD